MSYDSEFLASLCDALYEHSNAFRTAWLNDDFHGQELASGPLCEAQAAYLHYTKGNLTLAERALMRANGMSV